MAEGYLLDTGILHLYANGDPTVLRHVDALPDGTLLWVSAITLGETEFGHELTVSTDQAKRDACEAFIIREFRRRKMVLEVTRHTSYHYGPMRAEIFRNYPPKRVKENHPECCHDRATGKDLGIDENDLWIAAQAVEHQVTLVTHDNIDRIREAIGCQTKVVDWAV